MFHYPDDLKHIDRDVTVIAVTKKQSSQNIQHALDFGLRHFGENRVQEADAHWRDLRRVYDDVVLHLIGPLQSNKANDAVALFDVIHTIDREKIARAVKSEMDKQRKNIPCFIQVNTGDEPQKAGISLDNLDEFYTLCKNDIGLDIIGLMCIPPIDANAAIHFRLLKQRGENLGLKYFSMGMSGDYQSALACGATHLRIGSALFGERH